AVSEVARVAGRPTGHAWAAGAAAAARGGRLGWEDGVFEVEEAWGGQLGAERPRRGPARAAGPPSRGGGAGGANDRTGRRSGAGEREPQHQAAPRDEAPLSE